VELPLRGEWTPVRTPADRIPSHGTDRFGQRYAYDLLRLDRRGAGRYHPASAARLLLAGVPTTECYAWGEPVHPVLPGAVVTAVDGRPERSRVHPVLEVARVLVAGRQARGALATFAGNHVVVRHDGGAWSAYAHLAPGSVRVHPGQVVLPGDEIARVGHTGASTSPHLHVQLMDGPDPLTARGLPCAFRVYEVETPDGWVRVEDGVPGRLQRIRSVPDIAEAESVA
jgi:murein DD-endopeptidase MepM/ murein hydrolase activator NlpD